MTLLQLVRQLNKFVEHDSVAPQQEVNLDSSIIVLDDNTCLTFEDDEEDFDDDVDETNYNPYLGQDDIEVDPFDDLF